MGGHRTPLGRATARKRKEGTPPEPPVLAFRLALAGVVLIVGGIAAVTEVEDPFHGSGPQDTADAASLVSWGAVVLVNGAYVWRGARRRGLHDRFGRLLIIVGYVVLGIAMSRSIHIAVELWGVTTEHASNDVVTRTMLTFLGWGSRLPRWCGWGLGSRPKRFS